MTFYWLILLKLDMNLKFQPHTLPININVVEFPQKANFESKYFT